MREIVKMELYSSFTICLNTFFYIDFGNGDVENF